MSQRGKCFVFARTPELGKVKTRLQPLLEDSGCLALHEELVERSISTVVASELAPVEIWHTGNGDHPFWRQQASVYPLTFSAQCAGGLGERMVDAFSKGFADPQGAPDWIILMGSDCPELTTAYLCKAAEALERGEQCVIGPAEDGGYVLIGLRAPVARLAPLFAGISWGGPQVLAQTLEAARLHDCSVFLLDTLRDLDVEEDFFYFIDQLAFSYAGKIKK